MTGHETNPLNDLPANSDEWRLDTDGAWLGGRRIHPVFEGIVVLPVAGKSAEERLEMQADGAREAIRLYEEGGFEAALARGAPGSLAEKQTLGRRRRAQEASNPFARIVEQSGGLPGVAGDRRALDVGAGYGFDLALLCRRFQFAVGIEPQLERAVIARRHLLDSGVRNFLLYCGCAEELPFRDGRFDLVTANQVVEHMADRAAAFRSIARVLRPEGRFVFALPSRYSLLPEPHAHLMFLGWLPRAWQGWYAARFRGDHRYTSYTNLVSHWRLRNELRQAFASHPVISSGASVYTPASARGRLVARFSGLLGRTPLKGLMIEALGDMVGYVGKKPVARGPA